MPRTACLCRGMSVIRIVLVSSLCFPSFLPVHRILDLTTNYTDYHEFLSFNWRQLVKFVVSAIRNRQIANILAAIFYTMCPNKSKENRTTGAREGHHRLFHIGFCEGDVGSHKEECCEDRQYYCVQQSVVHRARQSNPLHESGRVVEICQLT